MATTGFVVSFETVTPTVACDRLPAASRAIAVSECGPFATVLVFHSVEYGADVSSAPSDTPSICNWTPTTPTASAALAVTATDPDTVDCAAGAVICTSGAVVSCAVFATATVIVVCAVFRAVSRAIAVSVCGPFAVAVVSHATEYGRVTSSGPSGPPSRRNCTPATATSSAAVAVTLSVALTVAPVSGEPMATLGGVVSLPTMIATSFEGALTFPAASCAVTT